MVRLKEWPAMLLCRTAEYFQFQHGTIKSAALQDQ